MAVGVPGGHVEIVQYLGFLDQVRGVERQFLDKPSDDVSPGFLSEGEMERLDGHFGGLLRRKARPLVASLGLRGAGLREVALRLRKPVTRSIRHG